METFDQKRLYEEYCNIRNKKREGGSQTDYIVILPDRRKGNAKNNVEMYYC